MINATAAPDRLLVLGAGSAIARSTVEQLTARGTSSLVLAYRHPQRLYPWLGVLRRAHPTLEVTTLSVDTTDVEGRRYANEVALRGLRVDALTALRNHQRDGRAVVLISASLDVYLEPLGQLLDVDAVLCSHFEIDSTERLTGLLSGPNVRGEEKVRQLRHWMVGRGAFVHAYGNSTGDRALLAGADHPHWV